MFDRRAEPWESVFVASVLQNVPMLLRIGVLLLCTCQQLLFDGFKHVTSLVLHIPSSGLRVFILHIQVNADEHGPIGEKFGVRGFPTIKFFGRGKSTASPEE